MDPIDSLRAAVHRLDDMVRDNRQRIESTESDVAMLQDALERQTSRLRILVEGNPDTGTSGLNERLQRVETEVSQMRVTLQRVLWVVIGAAGAFAVFGQNGVGALLLQVFGIVP